MGKPYTLDTRIPFAAEWSKTSCDSQVAALLAVPEMTPHVATAVSQLAARTDDPLRDVEPASRAEAIRRLEQAGAADDALEPLRTYVPRTRAAAVRLFGESLPEGLRLSG